MRANILLIIIAGLFAGCGDKNNTDLSGSFTNEKHDTMVIKRLDGDTYSVDAKVHYNGSLQDWPLTGERKGNTIKGQVGVSNFHVILGEGRKIELRLGTDAPYVFYPATK